MCCEQSLHQHVQSLNDICNNCLSNVIQTDSFLLWHVYFCSIALLHLYIYFFFNCCLLTTQVLGTKMPQETNAVMLKIVWSDPAFVCMWWMSLSAKICVFLTAFYKEDIFVISYIFYGNSLNGDRWKTWKRVLKDCFRILN